MSILQSEAERDRARYEKLVVKRYRPIGPAAIAAAVAAAKCGKPKAPARSGKTAGLPKERKAFSARTDQIARLREAKRSLWL